MGRRRPSRTRLTLAAVTAAHAGLFALLSLGLAPRTPPMIRDVVVAPVYLARPEPARRKPHEAEPPRPAPVRTHIAPTPELAAAPPAPAVVPAAPSAPSDADTARLASALRASRVGCANPQLLSEAERARCERRLADGAREAKYIPTPLPPERRAYYDAIAKAKSHERPSQPVIVGETRVPDPTAGQGLKGGSLAALQISNEEIRIPIAGCKVVFGGGKLRAFKPPHGLKLGPLPCYITPPEGSLTIEANIQNPDKVVRKKE